LLDKFCHALFSKDWLLIVLVVYSDEQEIAAAQSTQEEKSSGVKTQCWRPWNDQVPVDHPIWYLLTATALWMVICDNGKLLN
jgi:hypothetical protein